MPKLDKIEYMKRIFTVQGWIMQDIPTSLIIRQIIQNNWTNAKKEVDRERSAKRILADARKLWEQAPKEKIDQQRREKIDTLRELIRSMKPEYKGTPAGIRAITSVQKEIILLQGLRKPAKLELAGPDGQPIQTETTSKVILYIPDNGRNISSK